MQNNNLVVSFYRITSKVFVFLAKKSSNTKIARQLAGIRLSANTKKPQRTQRKIKIIIIFYLRVLCVRYVSLC